METIKYNKPFEWNQFLSQQKLSCFLQSWEWGEFQESLGRKIWRLGVVDDEDNLLGVALVVKYDISFKKIRKNYLYVPRGFIINNQQLTISNHKFNIEKLLANEIKRIAEKEKSLFIRFEPVSELEVLKDKRIRPTKFVQPKDTWILDLAQDEEKILFQMHHKTRYNIRLAERQGLIVKQGNSKEDVVEFFRLLQDTAQKNDFKIYTLDYYQKLFEQLRGVGYERKKTKPFVELYLTNYHGKVIAANMIMFFGNTVTYLYGGSDSEYRSLMAPQLLQWHTIKKAKQMEYKYYDFWGIAPNDDSNPRKVPRRNVGVPRGKHPWAGITRFKKSFGGFDHHYPGAFDLVIKRFWYKLYRLGKKIKR